ncbi:MAG TPA: IPT/TIG domain-containing protein [Candidatus Paceibacterota bacterium]
MDSGKMSVCSGIGGFLERSDCVSSVGKQDKPIQEAYSKPVVNQTSLAATSTASYILPSGASTAGGRTIASIFSDVLSLITRTSDSSRSNIDSAYTAEGFNQRYAAAFGLKLYTFSEYQVAPGTTLTAQGAGFSKTGNTVHIGGSSVSGLDSSDGFTLTFTVPSMNNGTYEAWVENEKGSSRNDAQRVMLMITSSPAPRPIIQSVSPQYPSASDTLTFYGDNFSSSITVITTMGVRQNVPANGGSFTLKLSDLPYFSQARNAEAVKGQKVSFFIQVQNENGVTRQPFVFDIQF